MLTPDAEPQVWAFARLGQALAYERRARGDLFDNIERAMACYRTVLEAFTLEHAPHYWAMAQAALGRLMARHWRLRPRSEWIEEAITHLTASLRVFGPRTFPLEWATVQVVLAGVHLLWTGSGPRSHAEDVEQAITHAEAALEVFTQEAFPFEWAEAQERLGLAYMERQRGITVQNVEQAIAHFRSALTVFAPERAPERQLEIAAALGAAYSQLGRWNAAVAVYRDAIDANELLYATAVLPAARQARMAKDSPIYIQAAYAMVCAATCQQQRAPQQRLLVEAIETIERNRAIVLGEALEHDAAEVHEAARHAPDAHAAFLAAVRRLRELESLELSFEQLGEVAPVYETDILRRVMLQGGDLLPPATWEGLPRGLPPEWWVNLRDAARGASKALHAALERIRSQPGLEGFLRGLAWEDLAGMVQPNEALVYLVTSEAVAPSFALLIIGSARDTGAASVPEVEVVKTHAFTHDDLERILARGSPDGSMSGLLPGTLDGNGQALRAALDEALPLVGAALIGPLAEQLTRHQVARATLVPCGRLATLPLHAATYQRAGDERPRCLLDEFDIAYAPSAKVLAATRAALPAKEAASRVLAAVVNPLPNPKPLPFAGLEVKAIADSVPPPAGFAAVRILQEQAATVAALLEAAQGASHVHLACHGSFVLHRPLGSELRLANGSRITLRELVDSSWFRDARLIVAAACQTALVDLGWARPLDEVIGWPAGFLRAGAPGVVGALWPVDDLACALLMPRFYRYHLLGDPPSGAGPMSPAGALRRAQQDLAKLTTSDVAAYLAEQLGLANPDLADTDRLGAKAAAFEAIQAASPSSGEPERPFAHPAEWAAFVLVGT